jgi:hypothetical protein
MKKNHPGKAKVGKTVAGVRKQQLRMKGIRRAS